MESPVKTNRETDFLKGFVGLMLYWLVGEWLVALLNIAIPGAIAGMLLLLSISLLRKRIAPPITHASHGLLSHLSLLYVPAGVGLMTHTTLLAKHGFAMLATLVLSTLVTLAITALSLKLLLARNKTPK